MTKARDLANIISGGFDATDIPNLDTAKITSGTFVDARLPATALNSNVDLTNLSASNLTSGTVADARLPSTVLNSNVSVQNQSAFKNLIINGDMSIAQRGTSASNVSTGYDTVDRFKILRGAGQLNVSQETDAPSGSGFVKSFKVLEGSSGANPGASDTNRIQQIFEGQNLQYLKKGTSSAESLTLSFWIKATVTGTYIAELYDLDNTRQISKSYTVSSASTWEYKTITFAGDTTGAFGNDNGDSMSVSLFLTAGSNFTSGTLQTSWSSVTTANRAVGQVNALASANDFVQITGVQLEAGTTASDFEFLPHDVNLTRCLRYFEEYQGSNSHGGLYGANAGGSNQYIGHIFYKVRKRARPTLSNVSGGGYTAINNSSGGDKGGEDSMYFNGNSDSYIINISIDAEL